MLLNWLRKSAIACGSKSWELRQPKLKHESKKRIQIISIKRLIDIKSIEKEKIYEGEFADFPS